MPYETKPRVVILGAGFAGLRILYRLAGKADIVLVDPRATSLAKPVLPEVAFAGKPIAHASFPIAPIAKRLGVTFIHAAVVAIDPSSQIVATSTGEKVAFDFLIITLGATKDYRAIPGLEEYGYSVCDDEHAPLLWAAVENFRGGPVVTGAALTTWGTRVKVPELKAPCEGPIGEVMFMVDYALAGRKVGHSISVFSPGSIFFEDVGPTVHAAVEPLIASHGIKVVTDKVLTAVEPGGVQFGDGTSMESALSIVIPPYRGPKLLLESGLGDEAGFLPVDETMRSLDHPRIYGAGDVTALSMPKLGHIAVHQADIVVSSLLAEITGKGKILKYQPEVFCIMNRGGDQATLILSDFLFGGSRDIAKSGRLAHLMKWSFDSWSFHTHGHLPPDALNEGLEFVLEHL